MQVTVELSAAAAAEWAEAWEDLDKPVDNYCAAAIALRDAILQAVRGE